MRTNQIPRAIPQQQWYLHSAISCLLGGILPFGAVSVELYFIMSALWLHQVTCWLLYAFYATFAVLVCIAIIVDTGAVLAEHACSISSIKCRNWYW